MPRDQFDEIKLAKSNLEPVNVDPTFTRCNLHASNAEWKQCGETDFNLYRTFTESKNGFGLSNETIAYIIKGLPTSTPV
jgi:hypothetical protein